MMDNLIYDSKNKFELIWSRILKVMNFFMEFFLNFYEFNSIYFLIKMNKNYIFITC